MIIKLTLKALENQTPEKRALAMKLGKVADGWIIFTKEQLAEINPDHPALKQSKPTRSKIVPLTREQWPLWAKALALLAKDSDAGLGDVVERTIGPLGGDAFKVWYERTFKRQCGCEARREAWNHLWPLVELT